MPYEDSAGLNVNNHYGPRTTGGVEGVVSTHGNRNEFLKDLTTDGLGFGFPVPLDDQPSYWVTMVDTSQVEGTVTAETIGGVDVSGATPENPVEIDSTNTGEIVLTGSTGGKVLIAYNKYSLPGA